MSVSSRSSMLISILLVACDLDESVDSLDNRVDTLATDVDDNQEETLSSLDTLSTSTTDLDARLDVTEGEIVVLSQASAAQAAEIASLHSQIAELLVLIGDLEGRMGATEETTVALEARIHDTEEAIAVDLAYEAVQDATTSALGDRVSVLESAGYATQIWVTEQVSSLEADVGAAGYVTASWLEGEGYLTIDAAELENLLAFDDYVEVDTASNLITYTGANVQIVNGNGYTWVYPNSYGNLIIGYNEASFGKEVRTGSHNLVVGAGHSYSSMGSVVFGSYNSASGTGSSVLGGNSGSASGSNAVVVGGVSGSASGGYSVLIGGSSKSVSTTYGVSGW